MPRTPRPADRVGLRLEVPPADRDRLMVAAAKAGMSMAAYIRRVVTRHLDELDAGEDRGRRKKGG